MGYGSFKQYDSRWGRKNYNGSSTMAVAGCGPTSVANLAYAVDSKITPIDTMKYMQKHGYAVRNNGTAWDGIPACMKHFGLTEVKNINVDNSMDKVWEYLSKGYCADFLFRKGSRGGVCWTTSGHFVAITGYKVKNGKHYLHTMDSGGRDHDGWYCYETQMRGLIRKVWVGKVGDAKPKPVKVIPKCIDVSEHQGKIDWKKVKASGIDHVVIRAGYGKNNIDARWKENITGAIKAGIKHIGAYWFSYAYNNDMAKNESVYLCNAVDPYKKHIDMPLFFDFEYDSANYCKKHNVTVTRKLVTSMHKVFCEEVKKRGFKAGYYYNYDYKRNYIDIASLPYYEWYALYDTSDKQTNVYLQQYSSKAKVDGIKGNVDINWFFGAEPKTPKPKPKTTDLEVDGKQGGQTIRAIQKWVGVKQDGILSTGTIKALQSTLGVTVDGKWGAATTSALQTHLNRHGAKLTVDGKYGVETIKALQRYLNKYVLK